MLTKLAVWYLRKRKKSVIIGFTIEGGITRPKYNDIFTFDNNFNGVDYRLTDGTPFDIPSGKFNYTKEAEL